MPNIALLALEASDATVVITSITLVFAMLVALCFIITLEGKLFDAMNAKKNGGQGGKAAKAKQPAPQQSAPAPKAPAAPAQAAAPAAAGGIPGEIVAAIAAAVAFLEGDGAVIKGIRRAKTPTQGSRRGAWGEAGVREHTNPFM